MKRIIDHGDGLVEERETAPHLAWILVGLLVLGNLATCGRTVEDRNAKPTYGETGLPKNCRAIIQSNLDGYHGRDYTAEEALGSIERNCGAYGPAWDE